MRAAGPQESNRVEATARKILIVDDDPAIREGLAELLRQAGYATVVAGTFVDGRRALHQESPDLLITDIRLDGFNGLQFLHTNPRPIPAIVITGFPDDVLRNEARRLGADYLLKPFDAATLIAAIARLLPLANGVPQDERRRGARRRVTDDLWVEANAMPARILDLSVAGVRLEIQVPPASPPPKALRLVFPERDLTVDVDVVWCTRDSPGRWLCGAMVGTEAQPEWGRLQAAHALQRS